MNEPDLGRLYGSVDAEAWQLVAGDNQLYLSPCGYMRSVVIELRNHDEVMRATIDFELTDINLAGLWATAQKMSAYDAAGMWQPIVAMPLGEPLPNMNAAAPYVLRAKSDQACTLRVMQLWHPIRSPS